MARQLAVLLGRPHDRLLLHQLEVFESTTGTESVDIALLSDIWRKSHAVLRALSLAVDDTTPQELYAALRHSKELEKLLRRTAYAGAVIDGECVSLNYDDVMADKAKATGFSDRSLAGMRAALVDELERRYAAASVSSERLAELMTYLRQS
ncbi:MAG: hypothetical protein Q4B06_00330 [Candidatus Saccharibacteria bacterium]|nr:hypothetical protein [Candidatus Saccharibacteria bacterium]